VKRILLAVLTTCLTIGMVGAGAMAAFYDTEVSTENVFTAGTMDLELQDTDEPFGPPQSVSATWTMFNMAPGVTMAGPWTINLRNIGSIGGDHVEISFSHTFTEGTPLEFGYPSSVAEDLAEWIQITTMTYCGVMLVGWGGTITDANDNGFIDLDDVTWPVNADPGGPLDNLLSPVLGTDRHFNMGLVFNAGAPNAIQGDTLTMTVTFTLNQDSGQ